VAESKKRKKAAYVPPRGAGRDASNPAWLVPAMLTCLIGGVGWIVVYYITNTTLFNLGNTNLLIGFGLLVVGAVLTSRWK
jgi:tetrahydromethanopterin S-methyltransferase subunit D